MKCGPTVVQVMLGLPGSLDAGIQEWPSPLLVLFSPVLQSSPMLQPPVRHSLLVLAMLFLSGCTTPWVGGSLSRAH